MELRGVKNRIRAARMLSCFPNTLLDLIGIPVLRDTESTQAKLGGAGETILTEK